MVYQCFHGVLIAIVAMSHPLQQSAIEPEIGRRGDAINGDWHQAGLDREGFFLDDVFGFNAQQPGRGCLPGFVEWQ